MNASTLPVPEAVLDAGDIQQEERAAIRELYRNAVLSGSEARLTSPTGATLPVPMPVYKLLIQILKDLSEGASVAILQERDGLTTFQASKVLGVSRQFFVNLLEKNELPFHKVGTHRRVYIKDLLDYKTKRDKGRRAVLDQMVQSEMEAGTYDIVSNDDFSDK
jgi:excisionase family DNA binding protein